MNSPILRPSIRFSSIMKKKSLQNADLILLRKIKRSNLVRALFFDNGEIAADQIKISIWTVER